jgi:hypothetical protein
VNPDLDQLSVATIRTLAMDAVQKARSGHPGTPMALAPVAYVLWQRFLRYDPGDPVWPDRDRFVLSNGHASMLLYALLHLSGVKAVDPDYETLGRLAVRAPGHRALSPARQQVPRPSRVPLDEWRGGDHRPARPGSGDERRHRDRLALARAPVQPAQSRSVRIFGVRAVQRRRPDGSAPLEALQTKFGFTPEALVSTASALLARGEG